PGPHAYYVTFAKSLSRLKMGPYVSINYSEFEQRINFPFGVNYSITPGLSAMFMNDARKSHLLMTYSKENWSVTGLLVWMKHPGISFSWGF
ncbi:MAG: hypothetical protein JNM34_11110, partial [Chthonomonadaceae bacterium]|nr:hypothetical protein [Chthonomonadaceae bacterium]